MKKKILMWIGISATAMLTMIILLYAFLNFYWGMELRKTLADLKSKGQPLTVEEVVVRLPAEKNAADIHKKIFAIITSGEGGTQYDGKTPGLNKKYEFVGNNTDRNKYDKLSDKDKAMMTEILADEDTGKIFALIDEALKRGSVDFDIDYSQGPGMLLPHLQFERNIARIVVAKAYNDADAGKIDAAYDGLLKGLKFSNQLKDENILITQLVRLACDFIIKQCLIDIAGKNGISVEKASEFIAEMKAHNFYSHLQKAFDLEMICLGTWCYENASKNPEIFYQLRGEKIGMLAFAGKPFNKIAFSDYMKFMIKFKDLSKEPYCKTKEDGRFKSFEDEVKNMPFYSFWVKLLMPALTKVVEKAANGDSINSYCITYLGAIAYKDKNGKYPEKLDDMKPGILDEIPLDGCTGKPFIYSSKEDSFTLESADKDFQKELDKLMNPRGMK